MHLHNQARLCGARHALLLIGVCVAGGSQYRFVIEEKKNQNNRCYYVFITVISWKIFLQLRESYKRLHFNKSNNDDVQFVAVNTGTWDLNVIAARIHLS